MTKLSKEAMKEYQKNRRKALQGALQNGAALQGDLQEKDVKLPESVKLSVKPEVKCKAVDVKPVKLECPDCKAEYQRGYKDGLQARAAATVKRTTYERPSHHVTCTCAMCRPVA